MKTRKTFPILMSLMLGAMLAAALPARAQNINYHISTTAGWQGFLNIYDSAGTAYLGGAAMDPVDIRTRFAPDEATAQYMVMRINTNTYDVTATNYWDYSTLRYFNTAAGAANKIMHASAQVNDGTNFAGGTAIFSGDIASNNLPAGWTAYAFVEEFTMPGYHYIGQSDSAALTTGHFSVSRIIAPGDLVEYGVYIKGGNTAPNSVQSQAGIAFYVTNAAAANPPTTVKVDSSLYWQGFLNYYFASNNPFADNYDGGQLMGNPADVPATWLPDQPTATRLILGLNSACYDATSASIYSSNSSPNFFNNPNGSAVRHVKPTYYINSILTDVPLTFTGTVESNSLPPGYIAYAYIEDFAPGGGYVYVGESRVALAKNGTFTVSRRVAAGNSCQYGFYIYGTPLNPASPLLNNTVSIVVPNTAPQPVTLTIVRVGSNVQISFPTDTGPAYTVQYKTELADPSWTTLGSPVPGTGSTVSVPDTITGENAHRFYRASVQ